MSEELIVKKAPCQQEVDVYIFDYPQPVEFAKKQNSVFWQDDEIKVEKDTQDLLVNMTPAEKHGVITVLKLFTKYELFIGEEYWGSRFIKIFKRPEFRRMASAFAFFEDNVHAPFYAKLNEVLGLATYEFYNAYTKDETLSERMKFIGEMLDHEDDLISLAAFSMLEGAVLYSSFSFLKHFQSQGKNKLLNVVRGINFSVRDENIHSEAGAWCFRLLRDENLHHGLMTPEQVQALYAVIYDIARKILDHESRIIEMIFEEGDIDGVTKEQMITFVKSRIDLCFQQLGMEPLFNIKEEDNDIATWFYVGINGFSFNDFFSGIGNSYNRNWSESNFIWVGNKYER